MYCKHCGAKIEDTIIFCPSCGEQVNPITPDFAADAPPKKVYTGERAPFWLNFWRFCIVCFCGLWFCTALETGPALFANDILVGIIYLSFGILLLVSLVLSYFRNPKFRLFSVAYLVLITFFYAYLGLDGSVYPDLAPAVIITLYLFWSKKVKIYLAYPAEKPNAKIWHRVAAYIAIPAAVLSIAYAFNAQAQLTVLQGDYETVLAQKAGIMDNVDYLEDQIELLNAELADAKGRSNSLHFYSQSSTVVHVTEHGQKYHNVGCPYLTQSNISISLSSAESRGYTPCSYCH